MGHPCSAWCISMIGDIVYGIKENKYELLGIGAAFAAFNPKGAALILEIAVRVGYVYVAEQVRSGAGAGRVIYEVLTRKPGVKPPPIIPAADKAALRAVAKRGIVASRATGARLVVRAIPVLASPATVTVGAGLGAGFLVSHGIGQLPDVKKTAHIGQRYVLGAPV